jgi:delta 1-pyrroline-5-carboxylate dehydrogenase
MEYIDIGRKEGATVHIGGGRHGQEGYFVQPTIFTECKPEMKIVREEIFGPVAVIIKFKTEKGRNTFIMHVCRLNPHCHFVRNRGSGSRQ